MAIEKRPFFSGRSYDLDAIFRGGGRKTTDTMLTTVIRLKIGA